jgi:hypothetical protein
MIDQMTLKSKVSGEKKKWMEDNDRSSEVEIDRFRKEEKVKERKREM